MGERESYFPAVVGHRKHVHETESRDQRPSMYMGIPYSVLLPDDEMSGETKRGQLLS